MKIVNDMFISVQDSVPAMHIFVLLCFDKRMYQDFEYFNNKMRNEFACLEIFMLTMLNENVLRETSSERNKHSRIPIIFSNLCQIFSET